MLLHLFVENYALIDKLDIDFNKGFTVITGETGAGKSILLGALALVLGKRADISEISKNNNKCVVEATFNIVNYNLSAFFEENELDYDDIVIIRREITSNGKSRAFINDTPTSLNTLKLLAEKLVDIHSQHRTITLNDADLQLSVVDAFAKLDNVILEYRILFYKHKIIVNKLKQIEDENNNAKADIDYSRFLFDELEEANLNTDEQLELENELNALNHADALKSTLENTLFELYENDFSIVSKIYALVNSLKNIAKFHNSINDILDRLESTAIELKDIASESEKLLSVITNDPQRMQIISDRLELIYKLQKKHNVNSIAELNNIKNQLNQKLLKVNFNDEEIENLKKQADSLWDKIVNTAEVIHKKRLNVIPEIENEITLMLKQLAMPHACFKIDIRKAENYDINGNDKLKFLFSANKGIEPGDLSKIASGGELSRLMLAIKSMISEKSLIPTVIFDEIDTGVSGETAGRVGAIMKNMSNGMQLIAISHLPQIAAKSDYHVKVTKESVNDNTYTKLFYLNNDDKINEIARLLSSEKITDAARMTAMELLNS